MDVERIQLEINELIKSGVSVGELSDGYHSYNELYRFRMLYNAGLFNEWARQGKYDVHRSTHHYEGDECFGGGWFVVVAQLPTGQISNHYELVYWDLFNEVPTVDKANHPWDGHTSKDVETRMIDYLLLGESRTSAGIAAQREYRSLVEQRKEDTPEAIGILRRLLANSNHSLFMEEMEFLIGVREALQSGESIVE